MRLSKRVSTVAGRFIMHKPGIAVIATGLLFVSAFLSSLSFAQDQTLALIEAARKGDLKKVQELLKKGADVNAKDEKEEGITALMAASIAGHLDIVRLLLKKGADVNAKDAAGRTALMFAAQEKESEDMISSAPIVKLLLENGAEKKARDKEGRTARYYCADGSEAAELLR